MKRIYYERFRYYYIFTVHSTMDVYSFFVFLFCFLANSYRVDDHYFLEDFIKLCIKGGLC